MSGAPYFLRSFLGSKKPSKVLEEKPENAKIIPIKKGKVVKKSKSSSMSPERKKALDELISNTRKALTSGGKLKEIVLEEGSDIDKLQMRAFCAQMKVISRMLDSLKK